MMIKKYPWHIGNQIVVNKLDEVVYIEKDIHDEKIEKITSAIVNKVDGDILVARELIDIIRKGTKVSVFKNMLNDLIVDGIVKKTEKETEEFCEFVIDQIEKGKLLDENMGDFRGRLFERLLDKALRNLKSEPILTGVAIPLNDEISTTSSFEKCHYASCFKLKKENCKKYKRETVDFILLDNNELWLVELKVLPERFDCLTLQTMNKLRDVLINEKDYKKKIKLICVSSESSVTILQNSLMEAIDKNVQKKLLLDLEAHSWDEFIQ